MGSDYMNNFEQGTQIAYIPNHADGDINHPDVEFGFVTSIRGNVCFCRYWTKGHLGILRTTANSEGTWSGNLVEHVSVDPEIIQPLLLALGYT